MSLMSHWIVEVDSTGFDSTNIQVVHCWVVVIIHGRLVQDSQDTCVVFVTYAQVYELGTRKLSIYFLLNGHEEERDFHGANRLSV